MSFPRRHKFNAQPTRWRGRTYASQAECLYAQHLDLLEQAGEVRLVIEQPRVVLGHELNVYKPDFFVLCNNVPAHFVDVKGMETAAFRRNKKLWAMHGRAPLQIVKRRGSRFAVTETIYPQGCDHGDDAQGAAAPVD